MRTSSPWLRRALLVLVGAGLAACADGAGPAERLLQPQGAALSRTAGSLSRIAGTMPSFSVSATFDEQGGVLSAGDYVLTVPRRAVAGPTLFTFESVPNGYMAVRLTATSLGSEQENDVGEAGFRAPVLLSERFEAAGGLPAWSRLVIAWERPDGVLEPVPSAINPATKVITGRLSHFSQYVVASD
jgi:hypothetical protein